MWGSNTSGFFGCGGQNMKHKRRYLADIIAIASNPVTNIESEEVNCNEKGESVP
jgi:hypothetical protein